MNISFITCKVKNASFNLSAGSMRQGDKHILL